MSKTSTHILCLVTLMLVLTGATLIPGACDWCRGDTPTKKLDFSDGSIWIGPKAAAQRSAGSRGVADVPIQHLAEEAGHPRVGRRPARWPAGNHRGNRRELVRDRQASFPEQVARLKKGTDEAFDLYVGIHNGAPTALILANEPIGAIYGAYTFLEKLGMGFYLGGDVYPGTNVPLQVAEMDEFWSPALPIRGCVIWYNFLDGPVAWDLEDYKYFFDQMMKMKANLVSFPEYGHGLTNYMSNGKLVPGVPFPTSEWKNSS